MEAPAVTTADWPSPSLESSPDESSEWTQSDPILVEFPKRSWLLEISQSDNERKRLASRVRCSSKWWGVLRRPSLLFHRPKLLFPDLADLATAELSRQLKAALDEVKVGRQDAVVFRNLADYKRVTLRDTEGSKCQVPVCDAIASGLMALAGATEPVCIVPGYYVRSGVWANDPQRPVGNHMSLTLSHELNTLTPWLPKLRSNGGPCHGYHRPDVYSLCVSGKISRWGRPWSNPGMTVRLLRVQDLLPRLNHALRERLFADEVEHYSASNAGSIDVVRRGDRILRYCDGKLVVSFAGRLTRPAFGDGFDASLALSVELERHYDDIGVDLELRAGDILILRPDAFFFGFLRDYRGRWGAIRTCDPSNVDVRIAMASMGTNQLK